MSGVAVDINSGGIDELPAVERLMSAAFEPRYGEAWSKAQCLATFTMPGYALRVACRGEDIIGFAIIRWVADESELLLLAVDPKLRGQGVGGQMLADWIDFVASKGVQRFFLEMRTDNPAMTLYSRFGFTIVSRRVGYYRGNDGYLRDAVTMQHLLAPN